MNDVATTSIASRPAALLPALYDYGAFYRSMLVFALLCLTWSLLTLPLYALLPRRLALVWGRYGIMACYRLYDVSALDTLRDGPTLILAPNHPSLSDAPLILARQPNLTCVMKSELTDNLLFGLGARLARYIRNRSAAQMVPEAVASLKEDAVLLLYPEGTRTPRPPLNHLKKSIGVIAKHAQVAVQMLIIDTESPLRRKGWRFGMRPSPLIRYRARLGRRLDPSPDVDGLVAKLERYYHSEIPTSTYR
jgi:1-acyl-sn-glycerol-3-phosphate acyltransferase